MVKLGQSRQASLIPSPESLSNVETAVSPIATEGSVGFPSSSSTYITYGRNSGGANRVRSGAVHASPSGSGDRRLTITSAAVIDGSAPPGRLAADEEDLVMLSGSDDNGSDNDADNDDIDDVNLTVSRAAAVSNSGEGVRATPITSELELASTSAVSTMTTMESSEINDSFQHLADYTLNLVCFSSILFLFNIAVLLKNRNACHH